MVQASTDDGQQLIALNYIYLGHPSHQSSRYQLQPPDGDPERQSSSGILTGTGTGTGATGWCRSTSERAAAVKGVRVAAGHWTSQRASCHQRCPSRQSVNGVQQGAAVTGASAIPGCVHPLEELA